MENKVDYSLHYATFHQNTEISLRKDLAYWEEFFLNQSIFPKNKESCILELGCGMGRLLSMLKENGFENLFGVELDENLFRQAKEQDLNIFNDDALSFLSKDKQKYDVIYFMDVLEHIEQDRQIEMLNEIYKHLNEDGFLVLQVPNALSPLAMYFRYLDWTHNTSFTQTSLNFVLNNAGFTYNTFRPQHIESSRIRELKSSFYELYKEELNLITSI